MKLQFDKSGRRFFFLTFCVRGRSAVLSRNYIVMPDHYLADGRQLILSSFSTEVPVFPINYDNCHLMNDRNEELCRKATGLAEE